jgi:hypothetical protein
MVPQAPGALNSTIAVRGSGIIFGGEPGRLVGRDAAMRLHFHQPNAAHRRARALAQGRGSERASAEALLGAGHPLVALLRRSDTALEQVVAVTAVQAAAVVFAFGDYGFGLWLAAAAVVVQVVVGCRLALLRMSRRELCVDLFVEGTALRLPCIERERRRLMDPRKAVQLAQSIEEIVGTAARPIARAAAARPLFDVRVIRPVVPELREIAALLRGGCRSLQGVAVVERLLTGAATPLYGREVEPLRKELRRARYLLSVMR